MKGRGLNDNIADLITAIEFCEQNKLNTLLVNFDFEKAFDSVEWNILFELMEHLNFGNQYIKYIQNLYKNIESCTINCGYSRGYHPITRGLRQGCPLSSGLFLVIVEALGDSIRKNNKIEGIGIQGKAQKKHAQYADDLWALIKASQTNLYSLLTEVQHFSDTTGLLLNYNKTEIVRIGSWKDSNAQYHTNKPIQWSEKTNILGIDIKPNIEEMLQLNFDKILVKFSNVLNKWKSRNITLIGKIQIVNTLVISIATQKFTCLPTPHESFFKKAKEIITNFLWNNKKSKIAYSQLICSIADGGLKLIDLKAKEKLLKTSWIKKYSEKQCNFWQNYFKSKIPIPCFWECNINARDAKALIKPNISLLGSVAQAWAEINFQTEPDVEDQVQILWSNSHIRKQNRPLYSRKMYESGITTLQDLVHHQENRLMNYEEIKDKFGDVGHFLYVGTIHAAIPKAWVKKVIKKQRSSSIDLPNLWQKINSVSKPSSLTYKILITKNMKKDLASNKARSKWENELDIIIQQSQWSNITPSHYFCQAKIFPV